MALTHERFRTLTDPRGVLAPGALPSPARESCFTVFAQRTDARLEAQAWERHAAQFFGLRLGLAVPKAALASPPEIDAALVVLAPADAPGATRLVFGRPREDQELHLAEQADIAAGSPGLGGLARRCAYVWLVEAEATADGTGAGDRAALQLAAVIASVVLGPILSPDGRELFGVRTARAKLEAKGAPYR